MNGILQEQQTLFCWRLIRIAILSLLRVGIGDNTNSCFIKRNGIMIMTLSLMIDLTNTMTVVMIEKVASSTNLVIGVLISDHYRSL